jgi:thiol-disulfide isomerase/thioredoxin
MRDATSRPPELRRRSVFRALLALGLAPLFGCERGPAQGAVLGAGATLPPFALPDLSGAIRSYAAGRPMFLNFWATWCPPCRAEMDALAILFAQLQSRGAQGYAISIDADVNLVREFVLAMPQPVPILLDPERSYAEGVLGVASYPTSLLVDSEGVVVRVVAGPREWDSPAMIEEIMRSILSV